MAGGDGAAGSGRVQLRPLRRCHARSGLIEHDPALAQADQAREMLARQIDLVPGHDERHAAPRRLGAHHGQDLDGAHRVERRQRLVEQPQRGVRHQAARQADALALPAGQAVDPVEQAIAKGIPVVIIDSALESDKISSFVATDNHHGGILAARRLGQLLKGEGKIILMRYAVGSASTDDRERGFVETMKAEFPKVVFVSDDQYAGATSDLAQQKAQNLLTKFRGQFDGVFCSNESSAVGMLRALEGAGLLARKP